MSKKEMRKVMPSMDLLSEMECLEIHGGAGGATGIAINVYCNAAKCGDGCIEEKKSVQCALHIYCGENTQCTG